LQPTGNWVDTFGQKRKELIKSGNLIIVAPPLELLSTVADQIAAYGLSIAVAAQDLDLRAESLIHDSNGVKHTGQVNVAALIADCAEYIILGHSETRVDKLLTDSDVNLRLDIARKHNLKPIVCVANITQAESIARHDSHFSGIIAYEPPGNIGTGQAAKPKDANNVCRQILRMYPSASMLYGGSVLSTNIAGFLAQDSINGVLVGNKSSGVAFFQDIIRAVQF